MSIQSQLSNELFNHLGMVKVAIKGADSFVSDQMRCYAEREAMNTQKPVCDMSLSELRSFQESILDVFTFRGWIQ